MILIEEIELKEKQNNDCQNCNKQKTLLTKAQQDYFNQWENYYCFFCSKNGESSNPKLYFQNSQNSHLSELEIERLEDEELIEIIKREELEKKIKELEENRKMEKLFTYKWKWKWKGKIFFYYFIVIFLFGILFFFKIKHFLKKNIKRSDTQVVKRVSC